MKAIRIAVVVAAALMLSLGVSAQTYVVNADGSTMAWVGEKVTGKHNGVISLKDGVFSVEGDKMSGNFTVDMTSIVVKDIPMDNEYNGKLTGHLKSPDFFSVADHPEAKFEITKVVPYKAKDGEEANYKVTGNLTIKGITHEISFPAMITMDGDSFSAKATTSIDRSRWDIRYGSGSFFDNLGDKLIYDDFHLEINLVGSKG
ncbi:MAG TPA: YceI family protein [Calditrichia bacterium]|nr:YceI family protein [Calditrichia bacterium]